MNADDRWEVALIGRKLTNERCGVYLKDKPGGPATGGQILARDRTDTRGGLAGNGAVLTAATRDAPASPSGAGCSSEVRAMSITGYEG